MAERRLKPPRVLLGALEAATNRMLQADPDCLPRLRKLEGKVLRLNITGLGAHFYALTTDSNVVFFEDFGGEPDVILSAPPLALARMGLQRGQGGLSADVQLEGDSYLAQQFQMLMASLDVDWEELLAQRIGDIAARQAGLIAEGFNRWLGRSQTTVDMAVRDYIQEEVQHSPTQIEASNFADDVDVLRMDVDRLAARVQRLIDK